MPQDATSSQCTLIAPYNPTLHIQCTTSHHLLLSHAITSYHIMPYYSIPYHTTPLPSHTIHSSLSAGKTMMAKAVANATTASFITMVGSEFVQKYLGEGPRMVRDVFRLAREHAPAIIFIDEIDAIATKRFDAQTGADREVQRILLELLNQMDGFDQTTNVKVGRVVVLAHTYFSMDIPT
ncbi:AAA family ATPase [archaeon]|nr:MAG: AAA family ATPase [archaeon]